MKVFHQAVTRASGKVHMPCVLQRVVIIHIGALFREAGQALLQEGIVLSGVGDEFKVHRLGRKRDDSVLPVR